MKQQRVRWEAVGWTLGALGIGVAIATAIAAPFLLEDDMRAKLKEGFTTVAGLMALGVLYVFWRRAEAATRAAEAATRNAKAAENGQVIERFTRAIDRLASKEISIRLGGIYALENIAQDDPMRYYWTVMEVLCAFVREQKPELPTIITADSQAICDVIVRRDHDKEERDQWLNLQGAYLFGAKLIGAKLIGADLKGAKLNGAKLNGAKLKGADLESADLKGAKLENADLKSAYLKSAKLFGADLKGADLKSAYLLGANLEGVNLENADLKGADLEGAYLLGANLENAYLFGAKLNGAYLKGANLKGAYLKGAKLNGAIGLDPPENEVSMVGESSIFENSRGTVTKGGLGL